MAEAAVSVRGDRWELTGDLDFSTVPDLLKHRGADMKAGDIIRVDLSGVTRADSAGLALMMEWLRESQRTGTVMTFENVPGQLQSIARVCGLQDILFSSHNKTTPES